MTGDLVELAAIILAALALASLVASRRSIAEAWRPGRRFGAAAAQVLVTGGMLSEATFVENRALMQIGTISIFVAILLLAELSDARSRRYSPTTAKLPLTFNRTPAGLILLMWFWLYAVNVWFMVDEAANVALYRTASGVTLVVFVLVQRYRPMTAVHFYSATLMTISTIIIALPLFPTGFIACGKFKCNDFEAILQGPFQSGNLLGLAAAMCGALLLMTIPISARTVVVFSFFLVVLYATMARTASLALGAAGCLFAIDWLLFGKLSRQNTFRFVAKATSACIAVIPMVVGIVLVFRSDIGAFSNRGRIWGLGREAVSDYAVTGHGLDWWNVLLDSGYLGARFDHGQHSEYLLLYFSGGIVGLTLFGLVLYRVTYIAIVEQNSLARGAVVPLIFAVCGIFETIWNPLTVDQGTWLFYALVAACVPAVYATANSRVLRVPKRAGRENGGSDGAGRDAGKGRLTAVRKPM